VAEPEAEPLTQSQRLVLAEVVGDWAERHPRAQDRLFAFGDQGPFSPVELAEALRSDEGPIARQFYRMAQFALEVVPFGRLVEGFGSAGVAT
jgi:hypothetical protein